MAYAIMRIEKIKSRREMNSRYKHNFREYDVANANPSLSSNNREPIDMFGKTYERVFDDEIARMRMEGAITSNIRKDAVLGYEVMLTYSRDKMDMDIDEWVEKNVEWLQRTFNPKDNRIIIDDTKEAYSNNVKSVVVHMDESTPHIHAFVVPIDDKGRLNAKFYTGDRIKLQNLQTEYSRYMSGFSLERGQEKSVTHHQDVTRYYNNLKKAVDARLPDVRERETAEEYKQRADEAYRVRESHFLDYTNKTNKKIDDLKAKLLVEKSREKDAERTLAKVEQYIGEINNENLAEIRKLIVQKRQFDELKKENPEKAAALEKEYRQIVEEKQESRSR